MLEYNLKTKPFEKYILANTSLDAASSDDTKKHVLRARITKLEVLCARILVKKKLTKEKKAELLNEQIGAAVKDFHSWRITQPDFKTSAWKPLWDLVQAALCSK